MTIDFKEKPDHFLITPAVAGVKPEGIIISIIRNKLAIRYREWYWTAFFGVGDFAAAG
ncbi:MAG: hypothetical protein ACM3SR_14905 [Ignavibacteriales bacterium]